MIRRIENTFELDPETAEFIDGLKPYSYKHWQTVRTLPIRREIHRQLMEIQMSICCYCGLKLHRTSRGEIEHIAKKGGKRGGGYPEFIFTANNLAVACQLCNSSSKKGQVDVVVVVDRENYDNCTFAIVHPYKDDPDEHYAWTEGELRILITALTAKGRESVKLFELDSEAHTVARAEAAMYQRAVNNSPNPNLISNRVEEVMTFGEQHD